MSHLHGTGSAEWDVDEKVMRRFFGVKDEKNRIFIEVGAARPDYLSISRLFRDNGWIVMSVEPNPEFCRLQREAGNDVLEFACGGRDEDNVDFTVVDSRASDSGEVSYESFSSLGMKQDFKAIAPPNLQLRNIKVKMRRLSTLIELHAAGCQELSILSIDVEGWELEVLEGLDFSRHQPKCIILENLFNDVGYRKYLFERGYRLWRVLPPNDIYLHRCIPMSRLETAIFCLWDSIYCRFAMRWASIRSALGRSQNSAKIRVA